MAVAFRTFSIYTLIAILVGSWFVPNFGIPACAIAMTLSSMAWAFYVIVVHDNAQPVSMPIMGVVFGSVLLSGLRIIYLIGLMRGATW